ncbi:MAG: hypothetical protein R3232_12935 [Clostridia bacterium]|nr:hypothetical protein [Clostridia bacterium]
MAKKVNNYIIAVKDYENTVKAIAGGKVMPREASVYADFFNNVVTSCDSFDGLKKFIRASKFSKKDCMHYWEGLLSLNYTLIITEYVSDDENFVENSCDNELLKFISAVR